MVVEAGDLAKGAPLRTLCEGSARALALPCYPDEAKDLGTTITDALRGYGLSIAPDARDILIESLGGDRLATQSEIQKLALYAHGSGTVTSEDVEAIVSDVSGAGVDAAIDAAFAGDRVELDHALEQLACQGTSHATTLALSLRHGLTLLSSVVKASEGQETDILIRNWRGLHFRRKATVSRQLRLWTPSRLSQAVIALHSAVLLSRRSAALADVAASQALFGVAARARSASRDT